MTPDDFKAWRRAMGFSQQAAADELGISKGSVELYETGKRRDDGRPVAIPKAVELACAALYRGLDPKAMLREAGRTVKARDAVIAWTPVRFGGETAGMVEVRPLPAGEWSRRFTSTAGAVFGRQRAFNREEAIAQLFIDFHTLVVRDGIDPQVAHRAFLAIDEYAETISPDIPGSRDPEEA